MNDAKVDSDMFWQYVLGQKGQKTSKQRSENLQTVPEISKTTHESQDDIEFNKLQMSIKKLNIEMKNEEKKLSNKSSSSQDEHNRSSLMARKSSMFSGSHTP